MNEEIFDILEVCLQEMDKGVEVETILARYPKFTAELRPILNASAQAKTMAAPAPSQAAVTRGRARLMQRIAELREEKIAPRKQRMIPFLQRLAISLTLTSTLVLSGTGLVGASSSALPGQNLYPVKRGWEDVRLFFTFDEQEREFLEDEFEDERLHEVNELLSEDNEHHVVDFSGAFSNRNGILYVAEVQVIFPDGSPLPREGAVLHIIGWTTEKDSVSVTRFEILQDVPATPIIIESTPTLTPAPAENKTAPENSTDESESDSSEENSGAESEIKPDEDSGTSENQMDNKSEENSSDDENKSSEEQSADSSEE